MTTHIAKGFFGIVLLVVAVAGCSGNRPLAEERAYRAATGTGEIVLGAAWPWQRRQGVLYGEGMQLAIEEINAGGGVAGRPLRIVREDDEETVDGGRIAAQRLANNPDIVAVIGHLQSYITVPAAAIYDLAGLVMIAPTSTDPQLTGLGYRRVFRTIFTDREVGWQMAEFAARRGFKRVAIYYIRNQYGRSLANAFEERATEGAMTIVDRRSYEGSSSMPATDRTLEELVEAWKPRELDAVFIAGEAPEAVRFITEARKQGLTVPILGGDALGTPELVTGGRAIDGTVFAAPFHPAEPRSAVQRFVAAFKARFGKPPDVGSALGYDAVHVLTRAMVAAGSAVPDHVAAALRDLKQVQGVTGDFTFTAQGDLVTRSIVKLIVRDGRFECLETEQIVTARE